MMHRRTGSISFYFHCLAKSLYRFTSCTAHSGITTEPKHAASEKKFMGTYSFKSTGHSKEELDSEGNLESPIFNVGGYDWSLRYHPMSKNSEECVILYLKSKADNVKAQLTFNVLDKDGTQILLSRTTEWHTFSNDTMKVNWGFSCFVGKAYYVDCHAISCVVTVVRGPFLEPAVKLVVPPSDMHHQLGHLLETGNGADVTFEVGGQKFSGHKCILAARSPVFAAQFFGSMKEKLDTVVIIEEMEAPVFKVLLHFVYNDCVPEFEGINGSRESEIMAQHLLVAADRYSLDRLKIICQKMLCGSIGKRNVVALLSLAERHRCNHLKTACLKFVASPETCGEVAQSEEFQLLLESCPSILAELRVERNRS